VRLIHPSFHDFLIDTSRCNDTNFSVAAWHQHTLVAEGCLHVLQRLSTDMCKIGDSSLFNQEVPDLPGRLVANIHPDVEYACRYWASHLVNANIGGEMLDLLLGFCSNDMLNWLEVMSLLGELDGAINSLRSLSRKVKVRPIFSSATLIDKQC